MVAKTFAGLIKVGLASERPTHAAYLTDFLYYSTDTGALDWDNGTGWIPLQGPAKSEILQNKIISTTNNTITGITQDPFTSAKREGYIKPSLSVSGSVSYALSGLPSTGSYSLFYDTVEGNVSRFSTSTIQNVGFYSASTPFISRREWATRLKIRAKVSTTTNTREYIGFSTNLTLPSSDTPLGTTDSGILVGFNTTTANFSIFNNDGTGAAPAVVSFGSVAKDTTFRTFEMIMSDTNIVCSLDGANTQTISTRLPPNTTDMYLNIQCQNTTAGTTKTFDISKGIFQSDFV